MAYAKINQLLENATDQQQKQNIFAPNTPQQGEQGPGSVAVEKTTGAEAPITSQTGAQVSGEGRPQADLTGGKSAEAFKRNVGKQGQPKAFDAIEQDLTSAEAKLQNEANAYTTGQTQRAQGITAPDQAKLEGAIKGDQALKQDIIGFLGQQKPQADKFMSQVNTDVMPNLTAAMKSGDPSASVKGYLRKQSGPQYTQSEADLDYQLLQSDPNYRTRLTSLGQKQEALTQRQRALGGEVEGKAGEALSAAQQAAKDKVTGTLRDRAKGYVTKAEQDAAAERAKVLADREAIDKAREEVRSVVGSDKSMAGFYDEALRDAYYNAPDVNAVGQAFWDPQQVQEYQNIYELLGENTPTEIKAGAQGRGTGRGLTKEEIAARLGGTVRDRETAFNANLDSQIAAINDQIARERGTRIDAIRSGAFTDVYDALGLSPEDREYYSQRVSPISGDMYTPLDLASADEAARLEDLYGRREIDMPYQRSNFDYEAALRAEIEKLRDARNPAPQAPQSRADAELDKIIGQIEAEKAKKAQGPGAYIPPQAGTIAIGGGMPSGIAADPGESLESVIARATPAPGPTAPAALPPNIAEILRANPGNINLGLPPAGGEAPIVSLPPTIERPAPAPEPVYEATSEEEEEFNRQMDKGTFAVQKVGNKYVVVDNTTGQRYTGERGSPEEAINAAREKYGD